MYALNDVKYLFEINNLLMEKIISENKINDLIIKIIKNKFDFEKKRKPTIFKKKEFKDLSENNKLIFSKLYEIRDSYAKQLNTPPHNILENKMLFSIVERKTNIGAIKFNKRISKEICLEILNKINEII